MRQSSFRWTRTAGWAALLLLLGGCNVDDWLATQRDNSPPIRLAGPVSYDQPSRSMSSSSFFGGGGFHRPGAFSASKSVQYLYITFTQNPADKY